MRYSVQIGPMARAEIERRYGRERSVAGAPSRIDFEEGPLAAALLQFERFDMLPEAMGASIRQCHVLLPGFTPLVFVGVLVQPDRVEIAAFDDDPDYWDLVENDPGD